MAGFGPCFDCLSIQVGFTVALVDAVATEVSNDHLWFGCAQSVHVESTIWQIVEVIKVNYSEVNPNVPRCLVFASSFILPNIWVSSLEQSGNFATTKSIISPFLDELLAP